MSKIGGIGGSSMPGLSGLTGSHGGMRSGGLSGGLPPLGGSKGSSGKLPGDLGAKAGMFDMKALGGSSKAGAGSGMPDLGSLTGNGGTSGGGQASGTDVGSALSSLGGMQGSSDMGQSIAGNLQGILSQAFSNLPGLSGQGSSSQGGSSDAAQASEAAMQAPGKYGPDDSQQSAPSSDPQQWAQDVVSQLLNSLGSQLGGLT